MYGLLLCVFFPNFLIVACTKITHYSVARQLHVGFCKDNKNIVISSSFFFVSMENIRIPDALIIDWH